MCKILGTFPSAIRNYLYLATILMQKITSRQSDLSVIIMRRSSDQRIHVKPLLEAVVSMAREVNTRTTVASVRATRTNLMEVIIMETVIIFLTLFKRGEIAVYG